MKGKVRISAPDKETLLKATIKAFYGSQITLHDDGSVSNRNGIMKSYGWRVKGHRFQLIEI